MKYWIMVFTPETYEVVKTKKKIGVRDSARKAFFKDIDVGDRFIAYISREMRLDGIGAITSEAFGEETFDFSKDKQFPWRRKVHFEQTGLKADTRDGLFWGIAPFNEVNTQPGNYMVCKGGFVEIGKKDFDWLCEKMST